MLAELFGACVWIVIGAVPVDRIVFCNDFVLALAGNGDRAHMAESSQSMVVIYLLRELNHFQRAAQIHIQAALFRFPIQRCSAMDDRVGRVNQSVIFI